MAEDITIEGQRYRRRHPLGVLALSFVTLGVYYFYWYYQVNDELRRFEHDETISPVRSLMAVLIGWIIIVPPFIAMWNTATHIQRAEQRVGVTAAIEPVLVLVFQFVLSIVNPPYMQDHMNRIWDRGGGPAAMPPAPGGPGQLPPPP